jgi:mono/diheme cytochrome c family protein
MRSFSRTVRCVLAGSTALALGLIGLCLPGTAQAPDEQTLAIRLAQELNAACPMTDPADLAARERSAALLARSPLLREAFAEPVLWGSQRAPGLYRPAESALTRFNPLVWRRMYLSLFMFPGDFRVERVEAYTLLRMPCRFRNALDPGEYPYPFWHAPRKWESWERCVELIFVLEGGKVIAILRSAAQDPVRPHVARVWDGRWRWTDAHAKEQPRVSLYRWLFSAQNPHVARLEAAYRALEEGLREQNCAACHSPSNVASMNPLRLLNFPNQALTERHQVIEQLGQNAMPPNEGIVDESARKKLSELARRFAEAGDSALAYEGEFSPPSDP